MCACWEGEIGSDGGRVWRSSTAALDYLTCQIPIWLPFPALLYLYNARPLFIVVQLVVVHNVHPLVRDAPS